MKRMTGLRVSVARLLALILLKLHGPVEVAAGTARFVFDPKRFRLLPRIAGAEDDPDSDPDPKPDPKPADPDPDPKPDPDPDPDPADDPADDLATWKKNSRKHERDAKRLRQEHAELADKLKEREDADKSEQEKAVEAARETATNEVTSKYETERRAERLELAVTRQATKGVKIGDGDAVKTVKFADPDDALAHLERAIKRDDIEGDDIFGEDGKVDKDALTSALVDLLEDKPHLAASSGNGGGGGGGGGGRPAGDADAGKGKGGGKSLEDMTPDDHLKDIQKR